MLDPATQYYAVHDERGDLVGYCCFGPDARVPGGDYSDDSILDVGFGLRPGLTGRGNGPVFVEAIVSFARTALGRRHLRVTVAAWNRRAIRVYEKAGFRTTLTFTHSSPGGLANGSTDWWQMIKDDRPVHFVCTRETFVPERRPHPFRLRRLGPTDYPLALEAWHLRGGSLSRHEWERAWPDAGYEFAGAGAEDRLLSVAAALSWKPPSPSSWELAGVWTRGGARNGGLATAVCSFVTAHILDRGRRATCSTTRSRPAMIRVAERLGYRRVDEEPE